MSQVAPNGQVRFLKEVPLDKNYENSIDFLTETAQSTYFLGLTPVHTQSNCTYIRDGVIRVDALRDTILPCNYLMFKNINFSSKWFYAFIVDVHFVNNQTCEVEYQIDDVQTWMFDTTLKMCMVEREHTTTDGLFEHIIDEDISIQERVCCAEESKNYDRFKAVLFTSVEWRNATLDYSDCEITFGCLNGLTAWGYSLQDQYGNWLELTPNKDVTDQDDHDWLVNNGNDLDKLNCMLYDITHANKTEDIVALVTMPSSLLGTLAPYTKGNKDAVAEIWNYTNFAINTQLDGNYVPTNKKLYNAPFCSIQIGCSDGQSANLQPEFCQTGVNVIDIYPCVSPSPSLLVVPAHYSGIDKVWEKAFTFNTFPQSCVSTDGYLAWVASGGLKQLHYQIGQHALGIGSNVASNALTGNKLGVATSMYSGYLTIKQDMNTISMKKALPDEKHGSIDAQPLLANNKIIIYARKMCAKKDVLVSMDNYFSMFGYKVNKLKVPSRRNRPHYTYLKTHGIHIDGDAPADAIERLEAIYDNGIRFWTTPSEVGDYTVNNAPV